MRYDRSCYGPTASDFDSPPTWEVWGEVDGVYTRKYISAWYAAEAEEAFYEYFDGSVVEDVEGYN